MKTLNSKSGYKKITFLLIVLTFFSCRQNTNQKDDLRDSALVTYIKNIDSLAKNESHFYDIDTNEYSFKFLKAYYSNDTSYLKRVFIKPEKDNEEFTRFWNTNVPILKRLKIEEGYQFQYSETFCSNYYVITITKNTDTIRLNKIIFNPTRIENGQPLDIKIIETDNKQLLATDWDKLIQTLALADYWNLKAKNNNVVLDPSFLTVLGIQKEKENNYAIDKKHSVERTLFRQTAIYKSFLLALKLANIDKVCKD